MAPAAVTDRSRDPSSTSAMREDDSPQKLNDLSVVVVRAMINPVGKKTYIPIFSQKNERP